MGCTGYIKAVKLDKKGMISLGKHLLHTKNKIRPIAVSFTEYKMRGNIYIGFAKTKENFQIYPS